MTDDVRALKLAILSRAQEESGGKLSPAIVELLMEAGPMPRDPREVAMEARYHKHCARYSAALRPVFELVAELVGERR